MPLQDFLKNATEPLTIYTDGACSGNPGPGGWGVVFVQNKKHATLHGGDAHTTNNRMEMLAAIEALKCVLKETTIKKVEMYTDSRYLMDGITSWIIKWKKNDWMTSTKKPVKNKDLWIELDTLLTNIQVEWHWVKGHRGDKYNEMADTFARKGIISLKVNG